MWFKQLANSTKFTSLFTLIFIAIAIFGLQNHRYQKVTKQIENPDYLQQEKELQAALNLRKITPSFGFDNLVADSLYLEFIQYFGDETGRKKTGYSLVPEYFSAIAERDPHFIKAYFTLSAANSMYAGKAEKTVKLMERVLQVAAEETEDLYLLWTLKGMDETIFLGDIYAARYSYEKAVELALTQDRQSMATVPRNRQTVKFLATKPDPTATQINAWKSVLPHVVKENEKQAIRDRIKNLEAQLD